MMAICPAGPPKLMKPSFSQNRRASEKLTGTLLTGATILDRAVSFHERKRSVPVLCSFASGEQAGDAEVQHQLLVLLAVQSALRQGNLRRGTHHPAAASVEQQSRRQVDQRAPRIRIRFAAEVHLVESRVPVVCLEHRIPARAELVL